jgi:hypothetical protein
MDLPPDEVVAHGPSAVIHGPEQVRDRGQDRAGYAGDYARARARRRPRR